MHRKQIGFTLVEILIVISIFAIITAGIIPFTTRYATERQLINAVEDLLSAIQLQQSNAAQGVNGSWYGVEFDNQNDVVTFFEVKNPQQCPITTTTLIRNASICNTETREFSQKLNRFGFDVQLTYGANPPEPNITEIVEARFNRSPRNQEIILHRDTAQQRTDLQRMRASMEIGTIKRILVFDGGNVCSEVVMSQTPPPCISPNGEIGGPKIGRIFLVEGNL